MIIPSRQKSRVEGSAEKANAPERRSLALRGPAPNEARLQGLRPYQRAAVEWLMSRCRGLLADEMGTGKTAAALRSIWTKRAIVVCPAVVRDNWAMEANGPMPAWNGAPKEGWRPDMLVRVVRKRGESIIPRPGEIIVTSYDTLPHPVAWDALVNEDLSDVTVIVDEGHYTKNDRAQRTRKVRALIRQVPVAHLLTGTPLPNRPLDLYGVLETLELVPETFESWKAFVTLLQGWQDKYHNWHFGTRRNGRYVIAEDRLAKANAIVAPVMLRRLKSEVLADLPPKVYTDRLVTLAPRDVTDEMNRAAKTWDLYEATDLPPFEEMSAALKELAHAKIPAMLEAVEEFEEAERPLLVFSAHVEPLHVLSRREGWGVITGETPATARTRMVTDFQAGHLRGLGLSIQAGGVGITLTRASDVLFVDRAWNPGDNVQAEDRAHRLGQKGSSVNILRLVADHPLDRRLALVLGDKADTTRELVG